MAKGSRKGNQWRSGERYTNKRIIAPERHLIICEGKKTEPHYFEGMRARLKDEFQNRISIEIKGTGKQTLDVFLYARDKCKQSGPYDHVWLAYDLDDFPSKEFDEVAERCKQEKFGDACFHALWSNPCIEFWFLLHFCDTASPMDSKGALANLKAAFNKQLSTEYSKSATDIFEKLCPLLPEAKSRAQKLNETHEKDGKLRPSQKNPGTAMAEIMELLGPYLEPEG